MHYGSRALRGLTDCVGFVDQHGRRSSEIETEVLFLSLPKCLGIVLALEAEIPQQDAEYF